MLERAITTALLVLGTAVPAMAGGAPALTVSRGSPVGAILWPAPPETAPCLASGGNVARLYFTFTDPQGVDYAGVDITADAVRLPVSDHVKTYLWVNPGTRDDRAYRWRFEEDGPRYPTRHTIPVAVEVVPNAGPLDVHIEAKDSVGNLTVHDFQLDPLAALCR